MRLRATEEAARRLADQARADRAVPPRGWDVPHAAEQAHAEVDELVRLVAALRDLLPPDVRVHLAELARGVLLLVRAVVDWWLARLDGGPPAAPAREPLVEDIPVS